MIVLALPILAALTVGTQDVAVQPMVVTVQQVGNACYLKLNSAHVTFDVLLKSARRQRGRRAVVVFGKDAPYKCVGAAIITLQQAGVMDIDTRPSLRR